MNKRDKNKRGFSLLELIIAIFVLLVGIMGVLSLIVSTLRNTMDDRDQLIASGLAQEGIELVRNLRDNSLLAGTTFSNPGLPAGIGFPDATDTVCRIDYEGVGTPAVPRLDCGSTDRAIYLDNNGRYRQITSGGVATRFRRNIKIEYFMNGAFKAGVDVTSTVWWDGTDTIPPMCNLANQCISSQAHLANR